MAISVTEKGQQKLNSLMSATGKTAIVFGLQGGGCSGFTYRFNFADENELKEIEDLGEDINQKYRVFEFESVKVYVDNKSYFFLNGTEIDWKEDIMGSHFVFNNPNTTGSCGCGESVSF